MPGQEYSGGGWLPLLQFGSQIAGPRLGSALAGNILLTGRLPITLDRRAKVVVDGKADSDLAQEILDPADNLTHPKFIDGWFDGWGGRHYLPTPVA